MALFPAYAASNSSGPPENQPTIALESEKKNDEPLKKDGGVGWVNFSSYKPEIPKSKTVEDVDVDESSDSIVELEPADDQKRAKKRKKAKKLKKEKKEKRRKTDRERSPVVVPQKIQWKLVDMDTLKMLSVDNWQIRDNRREIENLHYDSVCKSHLAKFYNYMNRCFGNKIERIDRLFFNVGAAQNEPDGSNSGRYFNLKFRRRIAKELPSTRTKSLMKSDNGSGSLGDFIPISQTIKVDGEEMIYDAKLQMYRKVEIDDKDDGQIESGLIPGFPTGDSADSELDKESRRLNKYLSQTPNDVDAWKQFLQMQDRLFEAHISAPKRSEEKKLTTSALLERKLSIVEKASEYNPSNVELKVLRLKLGRDVGWDQKRLRDEWRRLEFSHVNEPLVWKERLLFGCGQLSSFKVSRQIAIFDNCLDRLSVVLSGRLLTHQPWPGAEQFFVECLLSRLSFQMATGHRERAMASFQALIEFNFRQPNAIRQTSIDEKRTFFEPFWDSNLPRVGDASSTGWANVTNTSTTANETNNGEEPTDDDERQLHSEEDLLFSRQDGARDALLWLELERMREAAHWLPWRRTSEPEDAERIVLFDDISAVLQEIFQTSNRCRLMLEFLAFCGFRLPPLRSSNDRLWYDYNVGSDVWKVFDILPPLSKRPSSGQDEFCQRLCEAAESILPSPYNVYVSYARIWHIADQLSEESMAPNAKRRQFRKIVKDLMANKTFGETVVFYEAYASGLAKLGAIDDCIETAEKTLACCKINLGESRFLDLDYLAMLKTTTVLAENKLIQQNSQSSLGGLVSWISNGSFKTPQVGGSTLLKTKNFLVDLYNKWCLESRIDEDSFLIRWLGSAGSLLSHLTAILLYSSSRNLEDSRAYYRRFRHDWKLICESAGQPSLADVELERSWNSEIFLIEQHLRMERASAPRILTLCVANAIREFPANARFIRLYVDAHLRGELMTQLRRFFDASSTDVVVWWMAVIYAELARYLKLRDETVDNSGTADAHRLRNVMSRSVEACPNSCILWRLYMNLEAQLSDEIAVKRVFYSSLRQCPWSKELYMDAIRLMPGEAQSIVDLMTEKELRVRVPWDELQLLKRAAVEERQATLQSDV